MNASIKERYERDGFVFPLDVLNPDEVSRWRADYERCEQMWTSRNDTLAKGFSHLMFPEIEAMVHDRRIVDPVCEILGPDLLVWNLSFFTKEGNSPSFVSWHQDLNYWGLDQLDEVTAWVALSEVSERSGCMRFITGSHRENVPHKDTFHEDNMLTRGQVVDAQIDESRAVSVTLNPGQMSLHHGLLMHASGPNQNDDRRIGVAIRYIKPSMRQVGVKGYAIHVSGEDTHGNFTHVPPPAAAFDPERVALIQTIAEQHNKILYREV